MADEVVDTPFGKFLIDPTDCVGQTVKAGTVWDGPGFLQVIAREHGQLGREGVTILDIGAHLGDWTVWLVRQGAWRVVAVEPAAERLKANLDLNKEVCAERVIVIPAAAYQITTRLRWPDPARAGTSGASLSRFPDLRPIGPTDGVAAVRLDDYAFCFGSRVSLIKIDAQGCDGPALLGLVQTIKRHHPPIVFEWEPDLATEHGDLDAPLALLRSLDYRLYEWPSHPSNILALHQPWSDPCV